MSLINTEISKEIQTVTREAHGKEVSIFSFLLFIKKLHCIELALFFRASSATVLAYIVNIYEFVKSFSDLEFLFFGKKKEGSLHNRC